MTTVSIMGSTGSIGTQTLDVIAAAGGRYEVDSLGAHGGNVAALAAQAELVRPRTVALADSSKASELKELLPAGVHLEAGPDALADV
ncbi:MAG TPA: 1-deoxy-D-xylulose-5-phosphate reductoisomerase, partial [Microthrixaceae bacterium]|nr:1-deoxy-D-xylulose-5-phosphate reductoisomerase [Microthrixaceae bacterium]